MANSPQAQQIPTTVNDVFMSQDEIIKIGQSDPARASAILDLQDRLAARRRKDDEVRKQAALQLQVLQSIEKQMADEHAYQQDCENRGHAMPDGTIAISGQRTGDGQYFLICCRCSKNFKGIGSGKGQLPVHLANRLNTERLGR